jgi:histidinol-phosphate/aromatic aminotransferase/cobyric acid decarboxylase-like protein
MIDRSVMNSSDYMKKEMVSPMGFMDFVSDSNPLGPSRKAINAVRKSIKLLGYHPDEVPGNLVSLICKREHVGSDNILLGPDPAHALHGLLKMTAARTVFVPSPLPDQLKTILQGHQVEVSFFHLEGARGFSCEPGEFIQGIENNDCIILQNPNKLTGTVLSANSLDMIMERAQALKKVLIIDESVMDFCGEPSPVQKSILPGKALLLRTFSDFHALAGFRLGYIIGHSVFIQEIRKHLHYPPVEPLAGAAAIASLRDKGYMKRTFSFIREEKDFIKDSLRGIDGLECIDRRCNFLVLRVGKKADSLREAFLAKKILAEDFADKNGFSYVRLPIKKHRWNARFVRILKKITGVQKTCPE